MRLLERIRDHPLLLTAVVWLGVIAGVYAVVIARSVEAFEEIASEEFEPRSAQAALDERSPEEVEQSFADLLASQRGQLADAYDRQLERHEAEARALEQIEELLAARAEQEVFEIPEAVSPPLPDEMFDAILLIGSDASGYLADVIIYVLLPADGSRPIMVSVPRDLYLPNPCTESYTRINANLGGCRGFASGSELLSLAVEGFTGIEVDHFARVDFDGFAAVVDRLGGVQVCVGDHPIRDVKAHLELEAGCHQADGETALAWVRSRQPEYLIDDEWVPAGGSDFDRQRKQRAVLFQLARKLSSYSSVGALTTALSNLSDAVRMDSGWTISDVAALGIRYRGIDESNVTILRLEVGTYRTARGSQVLIPTRSFNQLLAEVYPPAAR